MTKPRRGQVEVAGVPVTVVPEREAEKADFVVCMPASTPAMFPDDEFARCCQCGIEVRVRPISPRRPPRLCMNCFRQRIAAEADAKGHA